MKGRTEEANALAVWLRTVTKGIPVRILEKDFHYSKAMWTEYRSGSTLIREDLLDKVVDKLVAKDMRESVRENGHRLLAAAREAAQRLDTQPQPSVVPAQHNRAPVSAAVALAELALRLDDARMLQAEAMRKLAESEKRCAQLQDMVSFLQRQSIQLTQERDRALEEARETRGLQQALEQSEKYRVRAEGQLLHARRAAHKAFDLRLAAEAKVTIAQSQFGTENTTSGYLMPQLPADGMELPPMEQIAEVLQAAEELLAEQDLELDELRSDLGLEPASGDGVIPRVVEGEVIASRATAKAQEPDGIVRESGLDNAVNNAVTRPDTASTPERSAIVDALFKATTPAHLGRQLAALRKRDGVRKWPVARMLETVNDILEEEGEPSATDVSIRGWLNGDRFPKLDWVLMALVEEMGATPQETLEFFHAHRRIEQREADAFREADPDIRQQGDESFAQAERRTQWLHEGWTELARLDHRQKVAGRVVNWKAEQKAAVKELEQAARRKEQQMGRGDGPTPAP
ncbi:hypothetical protein [Streptomyces sp. NPDC056361]|uniref:hypothetical protein n=1 Tax=Streptomyces sp. NPDC056361 TaxID=3345795 RepID=UPI0035DCAE92